MRFSFLALSFLSAFLVWAVSNCRQSPVHQTETHIFNSELASELNRYDAAMQERHDTVRFSSGTSVDNCVGFLKEAKASELDESSNNRVISQEYVHCIALSLLRSANRNPVTFRPFASYGEEVFHRLDITSFVSSITPDTDAKIKTMDELVPNGFEVSEFSIRREDSLWSFTLEVIASADIDNDGKEDWLLYLTDEAKLGSYRYYDLLVVCDVDSTGLLKARPMLLNQEALRAIMR